MSGLPFEKTLCVYTIYYPFSKYENHVHNEIAVLSKHFDKIYIFPKFTKDYQRPVPENVEVCLDFLNHKSYKFRFRICKSFLFSIYFNLFNKPLNRRLFNILNDVNYAYQKLKEAFLLNEILERKELQHSKHYSVWFEDWALSLSFLKDSGYIKDFICKAHGYDLFDFRHKNNYVPFQEFIFRKAKYVSAVSESGYDYLLKKYEMNYRKLKLHKLGVFELGKNPSFSKEIVIVTACNLVPVKRVDIIINALKLVKIPLSWYHFGSGPLEDIVKEQSVSLPKNLKVVFNGRISAEELFQFYSENHISAFLLVSSSEGGVPVSIQESMSFSIPVIATKVGGIPEIVNQSNGILLPADITPEKLAEILNELNTSPLLTEEFRHNAYISWKNNFRAEENFSRFAKHILNDV